MTNMDLMALLSTVVLFATIATTIFAVAAYAASRGYIGRKPKAAQAQAQPAPLPTTPTAPLTKRTAPVRAPAQKTPILKRYNPVE